MINFFFTNILFAVGDYFFTDFALDVWYAYCGIAINFAVTANGYIFYFLKWVLELTQRELYFQFAV